MNKRSRGSSLYLITTFTLLLSGAIAQTTWTDSTTANGNTVRMKIDSLTGVPHRLTGLDVDFKRYGTISMNSISSMSRAFLTEYAELFHLETESLVLERSENHWRIRWNETTGTPSSILGHKITSYNGAPLELTWSCYRHEDKPCGTCDSCALRARGFEEAGVKDPLLANHPSC